VPDERTSGGARHMETAFCAMIFGGIPSGRNGRGLSNRQIEIVHPLQRVGCQHGQEQEQGKDRNLLKPALIALSGIQKFDSHVSLP
jgi:hypothetical protein